MQISRNFMQLLRAKWEEGKFLCVGLDPDFTKIPKHMRNGRCETAIVIDFLLCTIRATAEYACAFKPNAAFFEAFGSRGGEVLKLVISHIIDRHPDIPVILDAKRGDIGNTNEGYVKAAFEDLQADAVTVNPYLGQEANQPFLDRKDKGIVVLCRTSNKGAGEFQDLPVPISDDRRRHVPLYEIVARRVYEHWDANSNCVLVVGATAPRELQDVRMLVGNMPILVPGIGAQGGEIEATVRAAMDRNKEGMIINSSRGILYASGGTDYAEAAHNEAKRLHEEISMHRR